MAINTSYLNVGDRVRVRQRMHLAHLARCGKGRVRVRQRMQSKLEDHRQEGSNYLPWTLTAPTTPPPTRSSDAQE